MGNRANIRVIEGNSEVWLYTHWSADQLPTILAAALIKRWRWDDAPYLTRIIFETMLGATDSFGTETGFGISSKCGDGGDRVLNVDVDRQKVYWRSHVWTFEEYVALSAGELARLW